MCLSKLVWFIRTLEVGRRVGIRIKVRVSTGRSKDVGKGNENEINELLRKMTRLYRKKEGWQGNYCMKPETSDRLTLMMTTMTGPTFGTVDLGVESSFVSPIRDRTPMTVWFFQGVLSLNVIPISPFRSVFLVPGVLVTDSVGVLVFGMMPAPAVVVVSDVVPMSMTVAMSS